MEVTVPSQVEEAAQLAEDLHAQMLSGEVENGSTDPTTPTDPDEPASPVAPDADEEATYEKRYKSLQGKYNAEVPRLSKELRELKDEIFTKLNQVVEQKTTPTPATPEVPSQDESTEWLSTFAETYGENFTENLQKLIAAEAKKLTGNVQEKVQNIEEVQYKAAQSEFVSFIDDNLKDTKVDWRSCWSGDDPKFAEFLQQPDPSGLYTYGDLAKLYNDRWDGEKLVTLFKNYSGWVTPAETPTQVKPTVPNPQKDALVAPSRTNTHTQPDIDGKKVWTQNMIMEFQANDRKGKYKPEESKAMWDDLLSALGENRIR